ncbi:unnamed protein product [Nippostrongylus brasiliensis]|uniref:Remorin_N domain-containing protein n=1 Tax=Nippostrongylus brasiliensis TaxID=27835 RepID=A0A0N4XQ71_NIPBR|nr:unnamed protein product [Nippostrongylus brasiliensis]
MGSGKENNGATMFATVKEEPLDYNDVNPTTQLKVEPIVIDSETRKDIERWIYLKKQVAKTKENIKCVEEFFEWVGVRFFSCFTDSIPYRC